MQYVIDQFYSCNDDNPKIITRVYNWNEKLVEFKLCELCKNNPDYLGFISETQIKEVLQK